MLSATRSGKLDDWHIHEFMKLSRAVEYSDGISPTQLFPLKSQVENCNKMHLDVLPGGTLTYTAMDSRGFNMYGTRISVNIAEGLLDRLVAPKVISLKVDAQVMLLRVGTPQELHCLSLTISPKEPFGRQAGQRFARKSG
ncbi:hypothetical protein DFH29DRAFT_35092 [Suillus ampliporus]|nr:hypothetical protein DFH29DRAFT_35092 [Suillus ampliporus]